MDTIIGLGQAGCNIADEFRKHSQYKIYKIDASDDSDQNDWSWASYDLESEVSVFERSGVCNILRQPGAEEYEKNCPTLNFLKDIKGEVLFIVGGAGDISGASLSILEQLKHCSISILYIRPDINALNLIKSRQEWVTFNVLQEYTRSGIFKRIYLIDNLQIEKHLENVPVIGYYDKLNNMIVSLLHMINVYDHIGSVIDTFSNPPQGCRISTIGFYDSELHENKLFYLLDNVKEIRYYYAINKKKLETDSDILKKVREQAESDIKTSYGIFSTDYEEDYVYTIAHTSEIQRQKNEKST